MTKPRRNTSRSRLSSGAFDATPVRRVVPESQADWRDVECPSCKQPPKEHCIHMGTPGRPGTPGKQCGVHPSRKRLAQKRWNEKHL